MCLRDALKKLAVVSPETLCVCKFPRGWGKTRYRAAYEPKRGYCGRNEQQQVLARSGLAQISQQLIARLIGTDYRFLRKSQHADRTIARALLPFMEQCLLVIN